MKRIAFMRRAALPAALAGVLLASNASAQSCVAGRSAPFEANIQFKEAYLPGVTCPVPFLATAPVFGLTGSGTTNIASGPITVSSNNCVVSPSVRVAGGADFVGPRFELTTANGDRLEAAYIGTASPALSGPDPREFNLNGSFTIIGGTGRFKNAQGCGTLSGSESTQLVNGFPVYGFGDITLQGVISYSAVKGANGKEN